MSDQHQDLFSCTIFGSSPMISSQPQSEYQVCSQQNSTTFEEDIQKRVPNKTKKIEKSQKDKNQNQQKRRTRNYGIGSKWTEQDQIKYLKFWIQYAIKFPYLSLSYKYWKSSNVFKQMAVYISKTDKQCKSYDQNMKKRKIIEYQNKLDLLDIVYIQLEQYQNNDPSIKNLLQQFRKTCQQKSNHMIRLDQIINLNKQQLNLFDQFFQQIMEKQ